MLQPSTLLQKRYRIIELHEMGRENLVYRAQDEFRRADVAVKENAYHDDAHQRQFRLEGVILANLIHPNIPRALDFLDEDGQQFIIMDFIEGISLQQLLQQRSLATEEILNWAAALCDALAYLHSHIPTIIHRDVEPSNIILANNSRIFLVDFGYAKIYTKELEADLQKRRTTRTDTRSDQYSLAATIYFLLTGAPPVDGLQRAMDKSVLQPIRPQRLDLSASTEEAIYRALSIDADARFASIDEFKSALKPENKESRKQLGNSGAEKRGEPIHGDFETSEFCYSSPAINLIRSHGFNFSSSASRLFRSNNSSRRAAARSNSRALAASFICFSIS